MKKLDNLHSDYSRKIILEQLEKACVGGADCKCTLNDAAALIKADAVQLNAYKHMVASLEERLLRAIDDRSLALRQASDLSSEKDANQALTERVLWLEDQVSSLKAWKDAVEDELVICGILNESHKDPRKAVKDIIHWNSEVALDPAVSEDARALLKQAYEHCALLLDDMAKQAELDYEPTSVVEYYKAKATAMRKAEMHPRLGYGGKYADLWRNVKDSDPCSTEFGD